MSQEPTQMFPTEIIPIPASDVHTAVPTPINAHIHQLIQQYIRTSEEKAKDVTPIHVDEIASKVARLYELLRKVVDWKEDAVLRRSAIERILKRMIFTKISGISFSHGMKEETVAEIVTMDLIRGGHLPNDTIPREYIPKVAVCLKKYFAIFEHTRFNDNDPLMIKEKINFFTFVLEIAACEIEEILSEPTKENLILLTMANIMNERIRVIPDTILSPEEQYTQTYIACCRTLYDLDDAFIAYQLFKYQYPEWRRSTPEFSVFLQQNIRALKQHTDNLLEHPLRKKFNAICEAMDTVFMLLDDLIEEHKENPQVLASVLEDKNRVQELIGVYYDRRYATLKNRLFRYGIFSTLSVFLSNSFTFFLVEIPMAELFYEGFDLFTTAIDFLVPTALMFAMVSIIRPPPASNRQKAIEATMNFIYGTGKRKHMEIYAHQKRHPVLMMMVTILYVAMTLFMFSVVAWIFWFARLPVTSVIFDTFTIALTIFAAVLIRNKSKELSVDDKMHMWDFFLDTISIPVAKIGSFLAAKWKEYNIIAIFFNFVIETPFAFLVDFVESWSQYLKDRRAELH